MTSMRREQFRRVAAVKTARVMFAIRDYEDLRGRGPKVDTLQRLAALRSHSNAHQHVQKLVRLGLAARDGSRGELYLTDAGRDLLRRVTYRKASERRPA